MVEVVVAETGERGAREHDAVDYACMNESVGENQRIAGGYGGNQTGVGMIAAVVEQRGGVVAAVALVEQRKEHFQIGVLNLSGREQTCRRGGHRYSL